MSLPASLSSSPNCRACPLIRSAIPSACRRRLFVARPTFCLARPLVIRNLFPILLTKLIAPSAETAGLNRHRSPVSPLLPARSHFIPEREQSSGNGPPGYDPLHWLAGDLCDELVVAVVMQNGDTFSFRHCSDQQVREAHRSHAPASPQRSLDVKCAPPVLIASSQPLVPSTSVGSEFIELCAAPGRPAELELDDTTGTHDARHDQRRKNCGHRWMTHARQGARVREVACYRCHAARITSSFSRSPRLPDVSLSRSRRRAASAVNSRRAALTVSFLVAVPSACWAASRYSSLISMRVLAITHLPLVKYIPESAFRIYPALDNDVTSLLRPRETPIRHRHGRPGRLGPWMC